MALRQYVSERNGKRYWNKNRKGDKIRIATFNIWNSDRGMPRRGEQIIEEIKKVNADLICLQEVREDFYNKIKSEISEYKYDYYHTINNKYDGLLVLSRYPILTKRYTKSAVPTTFEYEDDSFLLVDVHLPSDNITQEELDIVNILREIDDIDTDHAILAGDFNCSVNSSVHHYLKGERTLLNSEANPRFYDLAEVYADITDSIPEKTLDLRDNPRWKGRNYTYTSSRLDRIYLRDTFPRSPPLLESFSLFGKDVDEKSGYCASDHYGVVAEIIIDQL